MDATKKGGGVSPQWLARFAGLCYLLIAAIAMYAIMGVFERLIVSADAAATARNIAAHTQLFRTGVALQIVVLLLDVLVAWALYVLMAPVSASLSLLCAWLRLTYVFVHGAALVALIGVLYIETRGLAGFDEAGRASLIGLLTGMYQGGFGVSLIFFGAHLLALGWLIFRSTFLPKVFGALLALACLGYVANSFAFVLAYRELAAALESFMMVTGMVGEFTLLGWLLIRGVNAEKWRAQNAAAAG